MSVHDLRAADDDELLERLARAFHEEHQPPASGLVSLLVALDDVFGDAPAALAPVVPFSRRATRIVLGVAASLVALAIGLAWAGWPPQPGTPSDLDQLRYATTSLQNDLEQGDSTLVAQDVTTLARLLDEVPASLHAEVGTQPGRLLTQACVQLAGALAPRSTLPDPCSAILTLPGVRPAAGAAGAAGAAPSAASAPNGVPHGEATDDGSTLWYVTESGPGSTPAGAGSGSEGTTDTTAGTGTGTSGTSGTSVSSGTEGETGTTSTTGAAVPSVTPRPVVGGTTTGTTPGGSTSTTAPQPPPSGSEDVHPAGSSTSTTSPTSRLDD